MLNEKNLESYLSLSSRLDNSSLIPKNATDVHVSNIKKMSGGVTNELYSFSLLFKAKGFEKQLDLVLKTYPDKDTLRFNIHHPLEDVRRHAREFETMNRLRTIGFPVPEVYLCEINSSYLGFPFIIMNKEKAIDNGVNNIDDFAATLARLHNLNVDQLGIKALASPMDDSAFARGWPIRLRQTLSKNSHNKDLKKKFDYAINWLELNAADNSCPQYCLIHGEYHPGHTLITNDNKLTVIDWESAEIGDPAFDVGYAYHMVKLMCNEKNAGSGEKFAEEFLKDYAKNCRNSIDQRLEFYKVAGILGVAIDVSSWISNPLIAYRRFGYKAFGRALAFPFLRFHLVSEDWLNADFLVSCLRYCQDFITTTIK